jgi:hypothetical protein
MSFEDDISESQEHYVDDVDFQFEDDYEEECCFWLVKALRGGTTGRKLKRKIFKYGVISIIVCISLLIITACEGKASVAITYYLMESLNYY